MAELRNVNDVLQAATGRFLSISHRAPERTAVYPSIQGIFDGYRAVSAKVGAVGGEPSRWRVPGPLSAAEFLGDERAVSGAVKMRS
jgi:hypothetical protein